MLAEMLFPVGVGVAGAESGLLTEVVGEYTGPWKSFVKAIQSVRLDASAELTAACTRSPRFYRPFLDRCRRYRCEDGRRDRTARLCESLKTLETLR